MSDTTPVILTTTAMTNPATGQPVKRGKRMTMGQARTHVTQHFGQAVWEALTEVQTPSGHHAWTDGIQGGQSIRLRYT